MQTTILFENGLIKTYDDNCKKVNYKEQSFSDFTDDIREFIKTKNVAILENIHFNFENDVKEYSDKAISSARYKAFEALIKDFCVFMIGTNGKVYGGNTIYVKGEPVKLTEQQIEDRKLANSWDKVIASQIVYLFSFLINKNGEAKLYENIKNPEMLNKILEIAENDGMEIEGINYTELAVASTVKAIEAEIEAQEKELEELRTVAKEEVKKAIVLEKPKFIDGYKWNGSLYSNNRVIYRDNKMYRLTDSEYEELMEYNRSRKYYTTIANAINDMSAEDIKAKKYEAFYPVKTTTAEIIDKEDTSIKDKLLELGCRQVTKEHRLYIDATLVKDILKYETLSPALQNKIYDELKQNYIFYNYEKERFCRTTIGALLEQTFYSETWEINENGIIADLQEVY